MTMTKYVITRVFTMLTIALGVFGVSTNAKAQATGYVIITTGAIESNSAKLAEFVQHKTERGFSVTVVTEDDVPGWEVGDKGGGNILTQPDCLSNDIRNWLKANYAAKNLSYVLLVGNPNNKNGDVPMAELGGSSDYYYAELSSENWDVNGDGYPAGIYYRGDDYDPGDWDIPGSDWLRDYEDGIDYDPEVMVGRLGVYDTTPEEILALDGMLQKIIDYETAAPYQMAWRKHLLIMRSLMNGNYGQPEDLEEHFYHTTMKPLLPDFTCYRAYTQGTSPKDMSEWEAIIPSFNWEVEPQDEVLTNVSQALKILNSQSAGLFRGNGHGTYYAQQVMYYNNFVPLANSTRPMMACNVVCDLGGDNTVRNGINQFMRTGLITAVAATGKVGDTGNTMSSYLKRLIEGATCGEARLCWQSEFKARFASDGTYTDVQHVDYDGDGYCVYQDELSHLRFNIWGDPSLSLYAHDPNGIQTAPYMNVQGGDYSVPVRPGSLAWEANGTQFGAVTGYGEKTQTFTIVNDGNASLDVTDITIEGEDRDRFTLLSSAQLTVAAGSRVDIEIKYAPASAEGNHEATVSISSNEPELPTYAFNLSGRCVVPREDWACFHNLSPEGFPGHAMDHFSVTRGYDSRYSYQLRDVRGAETPATITFEYYNDGVLTRGGTSVGWTDPVTPVAGSDAAELFNRYIRESNTFMYNKVADKEAYSTVTIANLDPAKRYSVALYSTSYTGWTAPPNGFSLLNASGHTNAHSDSVTVLASGEAEIDLSDNYKQGAVVRWDNVAPVGDAGTSFTVKIRTMDLSERKHIAPLAVMVKTVDASLESELVSLKFSAGENGTVDGELDQVVTYGDDGTAVTAIPNEGYSFLKWSDGSVENPRMNQNVTVDTDVTAQFLESSQLCYVTVVGSSGSQYAVVGSDITLTADSIEGMTFTGWTSSGGIISAPDSQETTFTVPNNDVTVTSHYTTTVYTLTYTAGANGTITGNTSQSIEHGSDATTVEAVPNFGYKFVSWSDGSTQNPRTDLSVSANIAAEAQFTSSGLLVHYNFDETDGTVVTDASGEGNHGTLSGGEWNASGGKIGGAIDFSTTRGNISVPTSGLSSIDTEVTIAFWAYADPTRTDNHYEILGGKTANGSRVHCIHLTRSGGAIFYDQGGDTGYKRLNYSYGIHLGKWSHWAFVTDTVSGESRLYENGVLLKTQTGATHLMNNLSVLKVGSGSTNGNKYDGIIDDFRIYDTALAQEEIQALYNAGSVAVDSDGDGMDDAWEISCFGNVTNCSAETDFDGDGFSDYAEFVAGTMPTNSASLLEISELSLAGSGSDFVLKWSSVSNKSYSIRCSTNILDANSWTLVTNQIQATPPINIQAVNLGSENPIFFEIRAAR